MLLDTHKHLRSRKPDNTSLCVLEHLCSLEKATNKQVTRRWGRGHTDQGQGHTDQGRGYTDQGRGHTDQGQGYIDQGRDYTDQGRDYTDQVHHSRSLSVCFRFSLVHVSVHITDFSSWAGPSMTYRGLGQ